MNENQKLFKFMDAIHQEAEKRQNKINQETDILLLIAIRIVWLA